MRPYELMLILPAEADDGVVGAVTDRITQTLGERGGEIAKVDRWGKRRLAYPIDHHTEGYYMVVSIQSEPEAMKELDRVVALLDEVVRFKVVVRSAA